MLYGRLGQKEVETNFSDPRNREMAAFGGNMTHALGAVDAIAGRRLAREALPISDGS